MGVQPVINYLEFACGSGTTDIYECLTCTFVLDWCSSVSNVGIKSLVLNQVRMQSWWFLIQLPEKRFYVETNIFI